MKKNNIQKYIIFILLAIMISLFLFDNSKKNIEKYLPNFLLTSKILRPRL
jgi:uncharacterized membrane protein